MRDYRKIEAWQLADDLAVAIYRTTNAFPPEERYGLTSQMRRAAYSAPANIAEGASRGTIRDYLHFLYIARGSLTETSYFVHLAGRLGFIDQAGAEVRTQEVNRALACLQGLIKAVEKEAGSDRKTPAN